MKLEDFIEGELRNPEFRKCWEEEIHVLDMSMELDESTIVDQETLTLKEALKLLEEEPLDSIISNKGIKRTVELPTEVEFYEINSKCPVAEFIESISDAKLKAKILACMVQLAQQGSSARLPLSRYMGDGMYELRVKQSSNIIRIFYFFVIGNKIIMTNGYVKKTQKVDDEELKRAKRYRDEYSRRS